MQTSGNMSFLRRYVAPGLVFQSVVIGGGYATGRELVEFFLPSGPIGGVLGILVAGAAFSLVIAVSFEFARVTGAYDYRTFFRRLLGPFWVLFEVAYFLLLILILSVIGSAAGEILAHAFGGGTATSFAGVLLLMAMIAVLTFYGSETITRVLSGWSAVLYTAYITLFVLTFAAFGGDIAATYEAAPLGEGWLGGGIRYAGYNLAVVPAILFSVARLTRRRETIGAGLLAGATAVIPALLFYVAMLAHYPEIGQEPVPAAFLMNALGSVWLEALFYVVLFGTFVETGAALLHAVNERLAAHVAARGRALPRSARASVALGLLAVSVFAARAVGIVDLIGKGYGLLTFAFILLLVVPVLTVGLWTILRREGADVLG